MVINLISVTACNFVYKGYHLIGFYRLQVTWDLYWSITGTNPYYTITDNCNTR